MRFAIRSFPLWCVAFILLMSNLGCTAIDRDTFHGTWMFVAVERSPFAPPPPRFDVMEFKDSHNLRLHSTPARMDIPATYTLKGGKLTFSFQPPDASAPVTDRVNYRFIGVGNGVLVEPDAPEGKGLEFLYLRDSKLLKKPIAGTYRFFDKETSSTAQLAPDGSLSVQPGNVNGFYRLWKSRFGETLTWAIFLPEEGWMAVTYRVTHDGKDLVLAPIFNGKPQKEGEIRWKWVEGD